MSNLILLSLVLVFAVSPAVQNKYPDLAKPDDLKALGTGKIIQKDNSVYKNVKLIEVKDYWIVFEKNSSSHDMMMDVIRRMEFPETKWGALKIEFPNNKSQISRLYY